MARKRPCLDAEVRAFDLLERRDFLTKTDAMDVLRRIPSGEWARRHGGKMLMFGAYQRVATGMRSTARRYPLTTRLLTRIVRQWSPETYFTSIAVLDNAATPPHTDGRNSEVPGVVMSLTQTYNGGELWLAHEQGDSTRIHRGVAHRGIKIDVTTPFQFSARSILHATCPWQGDRVVMSAFSTSGSATNLRSDHHFRLSGLGFRPPTEEVEDRFRHEIWGVTVTRQLRFQPRLVWPEGTLLQHAPVTIDLEDSCPATVEISSDTESDVISMCMGGASPEPDYWDCVLSDPEEGVGGV